MLDEESIGKILGVYPHGDATPMSGEAAVGWKHPGRCDWCQRWCKISDLHPLPVNPAVDGWPVEICTKCNNERRSGR